MRRPFKENSMKRLEIQFWRIAKFIIKRGYGADCPISDLDDGILGEKLCSDAIMHSGRCGSCRAKETIDWIDQHVELL